MASKEKGGQGLPNLKMDYWAAPLRAIVVWMTKNEETGWLSIEQNSLTGISLSTLPFLGQQTKRRIKINNIWVKHTLKIWNSVQKQLKGSMALSRALPILGNLDFLPSLTHLTYRKWVEKSLVIVNQLFENNTLRSFSQLQEKFGLPPNDFYRYLQLRHYLTGHTDWEGLKKDPTDVERYFIHINKASGITYT